MQLSYAKHQPPGRRGYYAPVGRYYAPVGGGTTPPLYYALVGGGTTPLRYYALVGGGTTPRWGRVLRPGREGVLRSGTGGGYYAPVRGGVLGRFLLSNFSHTRVTIKLYLHYVNSQKINTWHAIFVWRGVADHAIAVEHRRIKTARKLQTAQELGGGALAFE